MKYNTQMNILKVSAVADFFCVVGLVIALISVCHTNKDLRREKTDLLLANQILIEEVIDQQNQISDNEDYIEYLENIAIEADLFEYNK